MLRLFATPSTTPLRPWSMRVSAGPPRDRPSEAGELTGGAPRSQTPRQGLAMIGWRRRRFRSVRARRRTMRRARALGVALAIAGAVAATAGGYAWLGRDDGAAAREVAALQAEVAALRRTAAAL